MTTSPGCGIIVLIRGKDEISITVKSGDPGGDGNEFVEFMREALAEWYDGGKIMLDSELPKDMGW